MQSVQIEKTEYHYCKICVAFYRQPVMKTTEMKSCRWKNDFLDQGMLDTVYSCFIYFKHSTIFYGNNWICITYFWALTLFR